MKKPAKLDQRVKSFCRELRHDFKDEFSKDVQGFRKNLLRLVKASFPLRPGRPRNTVISEAFRIRAEGKGWNEVFKACLRADLRGAERRVAELNLRCAVRARKKARIRRKPSPSN